MNIQIREEDLGDWVKEEGLGPQNTGNKAVIWPGELYIAYQLTHSAGFDRLTAISTTHSPVLEDLDCVKCVLSHSHDFAASNSDKFDLEYGWALATDTANSIKEGLSIEESMRKIADTSESLLDDGGYAVYNLETTGSHYDLPLDDDLSAKENQLEYAQTFQDLLKQEFTDYVTLYEDPSFSMNPHLVWQKQS